MPFNQQMSFPKELTLRTTPDGIRLHLNPIQEIEHIHGKKHDWSDLLLESGINPLSKLTGELFDIRMEIEPAGASTFSLKIRGVPVQYDVGEKKLTCQGKSAPLEPVKGRIKLQVLVDRTSIEIFGNDGRITMSFCFLPDPLDKCLKIQAEGGTARINTLEVYELRSIWNR